MLNEYKYFSICKTNPEKIAKDDGTTVEIAGAMPGGVGDADKRNSWLGFLGKNINQLELVDFNNFEGQADGSDQGGSGYFWVEYDQQGYGAVEPINWDPVNYKEYPLIAGTAGQEFTSTLTPDSTYGAETATDVNVHYSGTGMSFHYELRVFDPNATNRHDSTMKGDEVMVAKGASIAAADATDEAVISFVGSLDVPSISKGAMALADGSSKTIDTWTFWEFDGTTETQYCSTGSSLWLVMSDANGVVMDQPIGWYNIKGSALAAGTNCDSFTAAGTP